MERDPTSRGERRTTRLLPALALLCAAAVAAGCGDSGRANNPRPPVPVNVSVQIDDEEVSVSPSQLGAGPITLLISNQSAALHRLEIDGPRLTDSVAVDPQDTAELKVTVQSGEYTLSVDDETIVRPAELAVGPERQSAQDQLLLP